MTLTIIDISLDVIYLIVKHLSFIECIKLYETCRKFNHFKQRYSGKEALKELLAAFKSVPYGYCKDVDLTAATIVSKIGIFRLWGGFKQLTKWIASNNSRMMFDRFYLFLGALAHLGFTTDQTILNLALHRAILYRDLLPCQMLIWNGADVNFHVVGRDKNLLGLAYRIEHRSKIKLLVDNGAERITNG